MNQKQKILVVDDELSLLKSIKDLLELEGFGVTTCTSAEQALKLLASSFPDLMVVDLRLPGMSGLDLCRRVRAAGGPAGRIPMMFLSTDASEVSKVLGLELGGDDYLTKPFGAAELVARIKALIRRSRAAGEDGPEEEPLRSRGLVIDRQRHEVSVDGRRLELSPKEFEILYLLVRKSGRVITREFFMERIWERPYANTSRVIDTHVKNLRKNLGRMKGCIVTVESLGYKWECPEGRG